MFAQSGRKLGSMMAADLAGKASGHTPWIAGVSFFGLWLLINRAASSSSSQSANQSSTRSRVEESSAPVPQASSNSQAPQIPPAQSNSTSQVSQASSAAPPSAASLRGPSAFPRIVALYKAGASDTSPSMSHQLRPVEALYCSTITSPSSADPLPVSEEADSSAVGSTNQPRIGILTRDLPQWPKPLTAPLQPGGGAALGFWKAAAASPIIQHRVDIRFEPRY
eukprot:NODE_2207_length_1175_cov_14.168739_g1828_i0.p1 GENE.NODE_2207_length_1175_cov_14.168739_g1828_i0~~NODE_2207_length_1175_cov_14.168739_g1828_i0.p1  ORF type:complete len:223 (+),score=37.91 NODE_2207_length_1175_cov_14.168739_g1828_i0:351-1019(+)